MLPFVLAGSVLTGCAVITLAPRTPYPKLLEWTGLLLFLGGLVLIGVLLGRLPF